MKNSNNISLLKSSYWIAAASELKKLRTLTFASIIIAFGLVVNSFSIPVSENLHISLTFLVFSLGSLIFGPVVGLFVGVVYDLLNFVMLPSSFFFPGYTLSTMLEFFIYGLFFYHKRITILKIFLAKFLVDYGIHVFLGSLWSKILFNKGYIYFFTKSIVKNTIMLPIEVIILVLLLQALQPILIRMRIIPKQNCERIPLI